jgi:hypothetical protein
MMLEVYFDSQYQLDRNTSNNFTGEDCERTPTVIMCSRERIEGGLTGEVSLRPPQNRNRIHKLY